MVGNIPRFSFRHISHLGHNKGLLDVLNKHFQVCRVIIHLIPLMAKIFSIERFWNYQDSEYIAAARILRGLSRFFSICGDVHETIRLQKGDPSRAHFVLDRGRFLLVSLIHIHSVGAVPEIPVHICEQALRQVRSVSLSYRLLRLHAYRLIRLQIWRFCTQGFLTISRNV